MGDDVAVAVPVVAVAVLVAAAVGIGVVVGVAVGVAGSINPLTSPATPPLGTNTVVGFVPTVCNSPACNRAAGNARSSIVTIVTPGGADAVKKPALSVVTVSVVPTLVVITTGMPSNPSPASAAPLPLLSRKTVPVSTPPMTRSRSRATLFSAVRSL